MVNIHIDRTISAPQQKVFDWLASPASLTTAPLVLKADWLKDSAAPGIGAVREVWGTGMWFREEITAFDPPNSYSYLIIRSVPVFDHEGGTLTFTPAGEDTHVDWASNYTHPALSGGKPLESISSRLLLWNFGAILARCAKELEG